MEFKDAVVIVTGGASGLGGATAEAVVAGGGAIEMELSKYLRDCSRYFSRPCS